MLKRIIYCVIGVVLLAGVAYEGMRLISFGQTNAVNNGSASQLGPNNHVIIDRATEVPGRAADLGGQITDIQGNSLFVVNQNKNSQNISTPQEVVIVKETKLYRDSTLDSQPRPGDGDHLQQTVELTSLAKISHLNVVEVWGQKRGARWIADLIVVYDP